MHQQPVVFGGPRVEEEHACHSNCKKLLTELFSTKFLIKYFIQNVLKSFKTREGAKNGIEGGGLFFWIDHVNYVTVLFKNAARKLWIQVEHSLE